MNWLSADLHFPNYHLYRHSSKDIGHPQFSTTAPQSIWQAHHTKYANRMRPKTHGIIIKWQTWCLILYGTTCTSIAKKHRAMLNGQTNTIRVNCFSQRDSQSYNSQKNFRCCNLHIPPTSTDMLKTGFQRMKDSAKLVVVSQTKPSVQPKLQDAAQMECLLCRTSFVSELLDTMCAPSLCF